jgi:hypothetical protein
MRLELLKKENPEIFQRRSLYSEVMKILESYNFKLTARRDILGLFADVSKIKTPKESLSTAPSSSTITSESTLGPQSTDQ